MKYGCHYLMHSYESVTHLHRVESIIASSVAVSEYTHHTIHKTFPKYNKTIQLQFNKYGELTQDNSVL